MVYQNFASIVNYEQLANDIFKIRVKCPQIARKAQAGQFVHILCGEKTLRRPISIACVDGDDILLVYAVRGEGTQWLSEQKAGQKLDIIGPLGNGFPVFDKRVLLVGGGIGVPPVLQCAMNMNSDVVLGFRNAEQVILEDEFSAKCGKLIVCTEDCSHGTHGLVTPSMETLLRERQYGAVLSCGPAPMLKAVAELAARYDTPCFVSLEERMGCGVGACLVCAAKVRRKDSEEYLRVCKDGPVFDAREVVWEC
ncbi:MAG: dihydroorotate dehydrogenase electron transfer subunit [Oscillospiraceae bacterium]|nr:dihydroorotate dehydrogenase electron transfer subunit [Oscillospiraceae bacterium]